MGGFHVAGDTVSAAVVPACVTENVRVIPPPMTVIVPLLEVAPGFVAVLMVIILLFDPLAGDTVSHAAASLLADHDMFEDTVTLVLDEAAPALHAEPDK